MSVPVPGSRALSTACAARWCSRCSGGAVDGAEGLVEERHADALRCRRRPASVAVRPGLPLDHLGEQGQPDRDHLALVRQPRDRLLQERLLVGRELGRLLGQDAVGPAERREDPRRVQQVEEVDGGGVLALDDPDLQVPHEPGRRHPEVVPDHDDRLDVVAVALPQGGDQLGVGLGPRGRRAIARTGRAPAGPSAPAAAPGRAAARPASRPGPAPCPARGRPCGGPAAAGPRSPPGSPRRTPVSTSLCSRGSNPALTNRRLAAARRAVDQADAGRWHPGRSTRSGSSRTAGSRAGRRGRGGRGAARGRSWRRGGRTIAAPWGRS